MLSTMVYADELNAPEEIPELDAVADIEVSDKEVAMARQLIESLGAEFEPDTFHDTYRDQVLELIDRKASGATEIVTAPEEPAAAKVVDLMSALEASVAAAKAARKRHPSAGGAEEEAAERSRGARRPRRRGQALDGQEGDQPGTGQEGGEAPGQEGRRPQVGLTA